MSFAVIHIEKGSGNNTGIGQHIDRTRTPINADPDRAHLNQHFIETGQTLNQDINARIAAGYKSGKAIRKDAVKSIRVILSGSHDQMKDIEGNPQELQKWVKANFDFLKEKFGGENIVRFSLHRDEKTPHLHAVIVPITKDGRLSAKEMIGGPKGMEEIQTLYGLKMEPFGLERGLRSSPAKHTDISEYYGKINEPYRATEVQKTLESIPEKGIFENSEKYRQKVQEHVKPLLLKMNKEISEARGVLALNRLIDMNTLKIFKRSPQLEKRAEITPKRSPNLNDQSQMVRLPDLEPKDKKKGLGM